MRAGTGSFFGRRNGKTLKPSQRAAMAVALPALLLDLADPPPERLASLFEAPVGKVRLEIGFGGGEHLLHEAGRLPGTGFIGVEPFRNSLAKAVIAIRGAGLRNVRLYDDDATALLDWLPPASLERVDLLYPDPWPKSRHWKRRFVNRTNLNRIARVLRRDGEFRFASDVETYVRWALREVAGHGVLQWTAASLEECHIPWDDWPGTRYEAKALVEGRAPAYLIFRKAGSISAG